ncbi:MULTISPECIES: hypothetical protein [unclassified Microbacterium]|uniref:hypothetical protein n=1 Tax=Microbacterium TaxID=33882 RepID=UPI003B9E77B9
MSTMTRALTVASSGALLLATVSGCSADHQSSELHFALTSAEAVFDAESSYPVNFVFLADSDDKIWTELEGVALPDGTSYGSGEFDLYRGDQDSSSQVGNITFPYDGANGDARFSTVELYFTGEREPLEVEVGNWALDPRPVDEANLPIGDAVAGMASCGWYEVAFESSTAMSAGAELVIDTPGIEMLQPTVSVEGTSPQQLKANATLGCSSDFDFFVVSPRVIAHDQSGAEIVFQAPPAAIGFQSIDEAALTQIRSR